MRIGIAFATLTLLAAPAAQAADAPLFRMEQPNMVYQEVERTADTSTVDVVLTAGGSVGKSMFLMRASCALMKARHKEAFKIEWGQRPSARQVLRFVPASEVTSEPPREGSVVSMALCDSIEALFARGQP